MAALQLQTQVKTGANWFYWIAGLSLVNTIAALSGSDWRFILGLGLTQFVDAVATQVGGVGKIAALVIDFFIAGIFIVFGVFAGKAMKWAFIVGMTLFALDTLLCVLVQAWLSVAFHAYAMWAIWRGYSAIGELQTQAGSAT